MTTITVDLTPSRIPILPVLRITQGLPREYQLTFEDVDGPVDLSTWTGEFVIAIKPFETPVLRVPLVLGADGTIRASLTAEQTAALPARPVIGGATNGTFQVRLVAPDPEFSQIWQGDVAVAGQFV